MTDKITNELQKPKILIVDDEEGIRKQLKWALAQDFDVFEAYNRDSTLELLQTEQINLVSLDVSLTPGSISGEEGIELLPEILGLQPSAKVIMVTANDEKKNMLEAISNGAYDYYIKPINLEEMKVIFKRALYIQGLEQEKEALSKALQDKHEFQNIIASCPKMQEVFKVIQKVSTTDVTVLIGGESGTGKELAARAIHDLSSRKDKPVVVINCGAIPESLLESELFGHEKGAFTDAISKKIGKFELANNGTLFLDEIGELSLSLQVKLLRFLQGMTIERVGGNVPIELDVRIIAATNSDLKQMMQENRFREDLFYRLSVVSIYLPPLRERENDIMLLANFYLHKFAVEYGKKMQGFDRAAKKAIAEYNWPGNVRELENKIKRAIILSNSSIINCAGMGFEAREEISFGSLKQARKQLEIKFIQEALKRNNGNISSATREIGISRVNFYDLLKKYEIKYCP